MKYRIGLDVGIESVGFAAIGCNEYGEPLRILDLGTRIFDIPEEAKTGKTGAAQRRAARSLRRLIRRRAHRVKRVRNLIGMKWGENVLAEANENRDDLVYLRVKGLDEELTRTQLARIMIYFAKHRGFKSNRKSEKNTKEGGKLLAAVEANEAYMKEKGYRTVGEMYYLDPEYSRIVEGKRIYSIRNKGGDYRRTVYRARLKDEINLILLKQESYGVIDSATIEKYMEIFLSQREYDEGPGKPSPYRTENYNVGKCTFETDEDRAPKASYTYEYCTALQKLNNLKIIGADGERRLTDEERSFLIEKLKSVNEIKFGQLRKWLKIPETSIFNLINYSQGDKKGKEKTVDKVERAVFASMRRSNEIRKALSEANASDNELIDILAVILSHCKTDQKRLKRMDETDVCSVLSETERDALLGIDCATFGALSFKAMKKLIPLLESGYKYTDACTEIWGGAGAHAGKNKTVKLRGEAVKEIVDSVTSPVVRRAVSQTLKVLNALIDKYGSPCAVNIETAREIGKPFKERDEIGKDNKEREKNRSETEKLLKETYGLTRVTATDILKYRLYEEQGCKCAYSQSVIDAQRLLTDPTYTEIDHIIPYSRSFDDSYSNKVLVMTAENRNKGNRIPYEYFGDGERWSKFTEFVRATYRESASAKKRANLLREKFTDDNAREWKARALQDTKYGSILLYNLINDYLMLDPVEGRKKQVTAVNGRITSYLRKFWGLTKIRGAGDKHHAQDAAVIAMVTDGTVKKITEYSKIKESCVKRFNKESKKYEYIDSDGEVLTADEYDAKYGTLKEPYEHFRRELLLRLDGDPQESVYYDTDMLRSLGYSEDEITSIKAVFVSRAPSRGARGALHKETIRSARYIDKGVSTLKTALTKLKLTAAKDAIAGYNEQAMRDDRALYEALLTRLKEFDGEAKLAFKEPFRKPSADPSKAPIVKSVLIDDVFNHGFRFPNGKAVAEFDSIVRTDVFTKNGKFYCVPVYTSDIAAKKLPNRAITANKSYDEWDIIDETYEFLFALYPNDLVYIENNRSFNLAPNDKSLLPLKAVSGYFYYRSINRSTGAATFISHDNAYTLNIGLKTVKSMKKCTVDLLGNITEVSKEKRLNTEWDS